VKWLFVAFVAILLAACAGAPRRAPPSAADLPVQYDLLIRNGQVYDGSGAPPRRVDVAVRGDRVAALLPPGRPATAKQVVDAQGLAVTPGFINVLSWATESLIADGRGLSDTHQGVTLEIFGEGWSMGPLNGAMRSTAMAQLGDIRYEIEWQTLGGYLEYLQRRGVTPNVASFVGAATVRILELGEADVQPDAAQLARMQEHVRQAMREGALGVGASLIYPPGFYARTPELIALAQAAAESGGGYVAHMRSEADGLLPAVDETLAIARASGQRAEIYHLKAAGEANWPKMAQAIARIEAARAQGLNTGANMYVYPAGGTGLTASLPPWVQAGGFEAMVAQLRQPEVRAKVIADMRQPGGGWENLRLLAGSPERLRLAGFKSDALKPLTGRTLGEVARERGTTVEDTVIDLIVADGSRVDTVYFLMSEENIELGLRQPWVSLGSDAESAAPEGVFLKSSTHPRAYGNFARFLGHYVRERGLMPLEEAVRRLTRLPAQNWKLPQRGCLDPGCFADLAVFDPASISDHATFAQPQQLATGMRHVWVNGVQVLKEGEHTGAKPGRVVRGPGWRD
jgi:N-acyl-D-amino-acid deacylase